MSAATLSLPINKLSERRIVVNNCVTPNPPSNLTLNNSLSVPSPVLKRSTSAPLNGKTTKRNNLGPGCSMLDWIRLCKSMSSNCGKSATVTEDELARHCTEDDAWTCYKGKVYNITPYFKFHPGGKDDLLRAAGKDCTILFDEAHKWVNIESMLKKCYIGELDTTSSNRRGSFSRPRTGSRTDSLLNVPKPLIVIDGLNRHAVAKRESESSDDAVVHTPQSPVNPPFHVTDETDSTAIIVVPPSPIRKNSDASRPTTPRWDWFQMDSNILIHIYTHNKSLKLSDVIVDVNGKVLEAAVLLDNWAYEVKIDLLHTITQLEVFIHSTKVEIRLTKEAANLHWSSVGTLLPGNDQMVAKMNRATMYRKCTITSIENITHDTKLYTLSLPPTTHMAIPVGHHIKIKANENGHEIERSYTPVQPLGCSSSSSLQLMIKLYSDGSMSQHLLKLNQGDLIEVSNPEGTFDANQLQSVTESVLIAAGSGFTPMVCVLNRLLAKPIPNQNHHLVFANKTERDILWRKELDRLANAHECLTVSHILSAADDSWSGNRGRITADFLKALLPPPSEHLLICVCGPQPFTTGVTSAILEMDYPDKCLHVFD